MVSGRLMAALVALLLCSSCSWFESPRERILRAISETEKYTVPARIFAEDGAVLRYSGPKVGESKQYFVVRPWSLPYCRDYFGRPNPADPKNPDRRLSLAISEETVWPRKKHAAALRKLLSDEDPKVRGVAAEALATLHFPEDVPRIGALLKDESESAASIMGDVFTSWGLEEQKIEDAKEEDDRFARDKRWASRTVSDYAEKAIKLMTDEALDAESFDAWWELNHQVETSLWYWRVRMRRDFSSALLGKDFDRDMAVARGRIAGGLSRLPAEAEVKIRLLARSSGDSLLGDFVCQRVGPDRLMELLEEENLWQDVDWRSWSGSYDMIVRRLMPQADLYFSEQDIPQLNRIWDRRRGKYWIDAAFVVGISKLLKPAEESIENANTRDGFLRASLRKIDNATARGKIVQEFVRVGLPRNEDFLVDYFFNNTERSRGIGHDVRSSVLIELKEPPLHEAKRSMLLRLLNDTRFKTIWTNKPKLGTYDRLYAIEAINVHAGKELIDSEYWIPRLSNLNSQATSLAEIEDLIGRELLPLAF